MRVLFRIGFALAISLSQLIAQETPPTPLITPATQEQPERQPPNPTDLKEGWFTFFDVPGTEMKDRIDKFQEQLNTILEQSPILNPSQVQSLSERIQESLFAYAQGKNREITPPPPPVTYSTTYSVRELAELNRQIRIKNTLLQSDRIEIEDQESRIATVRKKLNSFIQEYQKKPKRTEERLVAGLQWIALKASLEVAQERLKWERENLKISQELLKRLEEERTQALRRLTSTPSGVKDITEARNTAEKEWQKKIENLQEKETRSVTYFEFDEKTERAKLANELLALEVTQSSIEEAIAHTRYLFLSIGRGFSRFLIGEEEDLLNKLDQKTKEWEKTLSILESQELDWLQLLQRKVARAEEALATPDQDSLGPIEKQLLDESQEGILLVQRLGSDLDDARFLLEQLQRTLSQQRGAIYNIFFQTADFVTDWAFYLFDSMNEVLFHIGTTPITFIGIIQFLFIILISLWISRLVMIALDQFAIRRRGIKRSLLYRVNRLIQYSIVALGIIIGLTWIGFDFSNFVLIASALGVGIGFGLQSIFNNFLSGLIILFESQLKVGDYIELESGIRGEVKEINFRSTYVKTNNGIAVIIPNSEFINYKVINWTMKEPYRRIRVPFSVSYACDKDEMAKIVIEAAKNVPATLNREGTPEPKVFIENLGDNGIECVLSVWIDERATKRNFSTNAQYLWAIHDALTTNHIEIPYPHRVVEVRNQDSFAP